MRNYMVDIDAYQNMTIPLTRWERLYVAYDVMYRLGITQDEDNPIFNIMAGASGWYGSNQLQSLAAKIRVLGKRTDAKKG